MEVILVPPSQGDSLAPACIPMSSPVVVLFFLFQMEGTTCATL